MTIAIRYQSHGGNTKSVAEEIGKVINVSAKPIDTPINEPIDLLIVGGGVYKWGLDKTFVSYLQELDPANIKKVACFTTSGVMDKTMDILKIVRTRGIGICDETLSIKFLAKNHVWFSNKGYVNLTDKQILAVKNFARKCCQMT